MLTAALVFFHGYRVAGENQIHPHSAEEKKEHKHDAQDEHRHDGHSEHDGQKQGGHGHEEKEPKKKLISGLSLILNMSTVGRNIGDHELEALEIPGYHFGHSHDESHIHSVQNGKKGFNLNYGELVLTAPVDFHFSLAVEALQGENSGSFGTEGFTVLDEEEEKEVEIYPFRRRQAGLYAQLLFRFHRLWQFGVRWDDVFRNRILAAGESSRFAEDVKRYSVVFDYDFSKYSRLRLQYTVNRFGFLEGERRSYNELALHLMLKIGSHGSKGPSGHLPPGASCPHPHHSHGL
ncbi:MAG: hypothetical protein GY765_24855 [bacterium]|nr:hypothetical protein [bacterium]